MPAAMEIFKEVIPSFKELKSKTDDVKTIARAFLLEIVTPINQLSLEN